MALSTVQIANFALSKIGTDSTIESLTENSAEAKECNLWMDHSRQQLLSAFNWSFARVRASLSAHGDDPPDEWGYRYLYPGDCLKARFLENPAGTTDDPVPFDVEQSEDGTKSILTDLNEAILIYTKDVTTPSMYSFYFVEALATLLGSHIAFPLTGKTKLAQLLTQEARQMLIFAPAMDASEKQDREPRDAPQIRGRE